MSAMSGMSLSDLGECMRVYWLVEDTPSFPISRTTSVIPDKLPTPSTQTHTCSTLRCNQTKQMIPRLWWIHEMFRKGLGS